jgi:hypothetical protein
VSAQALRSWLVAAVSTGIVLIGPVSAADPVNTQRLSTEKIRQVFSNVRDDAVVKDSAGTTAVNYWHADGTFTNEWSNESGSGTVRGRWRAHNDQRCIVITAGLPDRIGKETCSPVLRRGQHYISINADGSIHGIHSLSSITASQLRSSATQSLYP